MNIIIEDAEKEKAKSGGALTFSKEGHINTYNDNNNSGGSV